MEFVDEIQETIVNDTDLREPGHEFNKDDSIYDCIGQLRMVYDYNQHGNYRKESIGTGTVFFVQQTKAFILTAAHNIRHKVVHCPNPNCDYYAEKKPRITTCGVCGTQLSKIIINATDITFKRRSRDRVSFGTMDYRYDRCGVEYINHEQYIQFSSIKSGYDWCVLSIIDKKNYYADLVKDVTIRPAAEIWHKCSRFSICGYPYYKPQKFLTDEEKDEEKKTNKRITNDGLYGMSSNQAQKMKIQQDDKGTMNIFLYQTAIDTEAGQSGASFCCQTEDLNGSHSIQKSWIIFAIHVGGSMSKRFNVGTVITNDMLCKIYDVCGIKTAIEKVDDMKSNDIWSPLAGKETRNFKAHVGIDFSVDGVGVAFDLPTGEMMFQKNQTNNPNIKEQASMLLDAKAAKPSYKFIAFGVEATQQYTSTKEENLLYLNNFVTSTYQDTYIDEKECKDENKKQECVSQLKAANGKFVPIDIVFKTALQYIKKNVMQTLKQVADIDNTEEVQWIIAIPHFWSEQTSIMLKAAEEINLIKSEIIDHGLIVTESECAATMAREIYDFREGRKYMLLEIGEEITCVSCHVVVGGNIIKYVYPAQIMKCGCNSIDQAFCEKLGGIFGKEGIDIFISKFSPRWEMMKSSLRKAIFFYDGTNAPIVTLDNEFVSFMENKHNKCVDELVEDYDEKSGSIECDEGILEFSNEIWDQLFDSVLKQLFVQVNKILKSKVMNDCKDILLIGSLSQSSFIQNKIQSQHGAQYSIQAIPKHHLTTVQGAVTIGLRASKWVSPNTMGIQTVNSGFCALIRKGESIYSSVSRVSWFRKCDGFDQKRMVIRLYSSDQKDPTHTVEPCDGIAFVELPDDKPIAILYLDKHTEKKLYVASKDWPDNDREIQIQWKNKFYW